MAAPADPLTAGGEFGVDPVDTLGVVAGDGTGAWSVGEAGAGGANDAPGEGAIAGDGGGT